MPNQTIQSTQISNHIGLCSIIVQEKWNMQILSQLISAPKRYNQIEAAINQFPYLDKISPKILSQRLKKLCDKGLITKQRFASVPPAVQYQITQEGLIYAPVLDAMASVGQTLTIPEIKNNEFDLYLDDF